MTERDAKILELLCQGVSRSEIARRLGMDRRMVSVAASRLGVPPVVRRDTPYDWGEIRSFYEAGHSRAECQRRYGFSNSAWVRAVARGDIVTRPRTQGAPGSTRAQVAALLKRGISQAETARRLGRSKATVAYHARALGREPDPKFSRRYDWSEVQAAHDDGLSATECCARFGFSKATWSQAVKRGDLVSRGRLIPLDQLLVKGRRTSRGHLKLRLLKAGLKRAECERCGISEWRGRPLAMQLHHINGDGTDNRLENLEFLCANCHSLTETYGGRNGHRRPRVPAA